MSDVQFDFAWGKAGLSDRLPFGDAVVIVDVLSFSTAVDVAVSRGAAVLPYRYRDATAAAFAADQQAVLAGPRRDGGPSLSPPSLAALDAGTRLVLPSPNGSTLSTLVGNKPAFAASLRNAAAVAAAIPSNARVLVIAAGEHWPDGSLRPALEDLLGAGAVLARLNGRLSPDVTAAAAAYDTLRGKLQQALADCPSGQELIAAGYPEDVTWAADEGCSAAIPRLIDGAYRNEADL